ncbi:MAG: hypothetical protein A4E53_00875 [Pelotomaculum sp. PtaB.Bin104]|nr:MAG: hypothetical protein A4E53_00875 [Pelotomaculum sp. PtaB.Bin104]
MSKEYQTIILAGLLHDVGKFIQRSDFKGALRVTGKRPAVSASFIRAKSAVFEQVSDVSLLAELVQRHHETRQFPPDLRVQQADPLIRPLAYLVSVADNYSSAERGDNADEYRDYKTAPLASVFSSLKLNRPTPDVYHYRLHSLNPANAFPEPFQKLNPKQTNDYLTAFGREFDRLMSAVNRADFNCLYTHLLSLLQRFTWCVPSNTQEQAPDISLYDHLRTTSAIAACLYIYHKEMNNLNERDVVDNRPNKFRLVVGDLSGIQNYIFDIANIGVGGVAKRLRSRSFYLSALVEAISHKLIHDFRLPITNIVMSSGGKFYVLLPNLPKSHEKIEQFQRDLDQWSVSYYGGELVVNLAQLEFNGPAFNNFGQILGKISDRLSARKVNPLESYLVNDGTWAPDHFKVRAQKGEEGLCQSCNKQIATYIEDDGDRLCKQCHRDLKLGRLLPDASYIAFGNAEILSNYRNTTFHLYGSYSFTVLKDIPQPELPGYLVYKLNETNLADIAGKPAMPKFMANYIPLAEADNCAGCPGCRDDNKPAEGSPIYFDCIANKASGRKLLGYLKADVDNLGSLFVYGLRDDLADRNSISRIATMSRMLDLFFSGRVEQLLNIRFNNCYTVFSGGDDLLIIGTWDEIVGLAVTLREEFKRFTNQNDNITISAGISLLKPGVPVSRSVAAADEALEKSKEKILKGETEGRDQLTLFGSTMKWTVTPTLLEAAGKLSNWLKNDKLTIGFLRKLLVFSEMHHSYYFNGEVNGLRYLPLLTYEITRNLESLETPDQDKLALRLWAENLKKLDHDHTIYLDFLVKYALLAKE